MRERQCKSCKAPFLPHRMGQRVCSPGCAYEYAKIEKRKETKGWARRERERLKTRSDWAKEAQIAFNAWIRFRDRSRPCISCDRFTDAKRNAGHYRTVGACPELRFDEDNCHAQCEHCNSFNSGNIVEYRIRLIERIGLERVEALEGPHESVKWTKDDLREIRDSYRARLREARKVSENHE